MFQNNNENRIGGESEGKVKDKDRWSVRRREKKKEKQGNKGTIQDKLMVRYKY